MDDSFSAKGAYANAATTSQSEAAADAPHVASSVSASASPDYQQQAMGAAEPVADISLQQAFQEVEHDARTRPFSEEEYAPAYQNVVTMTGTVASAPELVELRSGTPITKFKLRVRRPGNSTVDTYAPSTTH
jgi:hypothetical protein